MAAAESAKGAGGHDAESDTKALAAMARAKTHGVPRSLADFDAASLLARPRKVGVLADLPREQP